MNTKAIRDALAAATPGKWEYVESQISPLNYILYDGKWLFLISGGDYTLLDAHLIANCKIWLQQLLDEIERLEKEKEKWLIEAFRKYPTPEAYDAACAALEKHRKNEEQLQSDKAVAVETLRWYANYWNHEVQLEGVGVTSMQKDNGERARKTIERIESGEK